MNNDQKRTVLALVLSGIVLFSWQLMFAPKQDVTEQIKQDVAPQAVEKNQNVVVANQPVNAVENNVVLTNLSEVILTNGEYSFVINSDFSFKEANGFNTKISLAELASRANFFKVRLLNTSNAYEPFNLQFAEVQNGNSVTAVDTTRGINIQFVLSDEGKLNYTINSSVPVRLAYSMSSKEGQSDNRTFRQFVTFQNDIERIDVEDDEKADGTFKWFGLDFNYHLFVNVLAKKDVYKYVTTETGEMFIQAVNPVNSYNGYFLYSLKNYDYLVKFNDQVDLAIDFGLFGILAVPILKGMQYIYNYVGNYGWAIIILTFIIRFLTFPLQFKSFKSMKKMQTVQPELAKIKEKFKDDPARVQKETMELFKRAGANPLGGCLPMLLQVPFFIAFYQAINNSVELVGSPFAAWILDLSAKDPYYVLPVLMGLTMLLQTKLNPSTTADPNQQKVMYIMPLVFCFIMKDLPAGLNLYFCVSNILGIAQQLYVYKTVD